MKQNDPSRCVCQDFSLSEGPKPSIFLLLNHVFLYDCVLITSGCKFLAAFLNISDDWLFECYVSVCYLWIKRSLFLFYCNHLFLHIHLQRNLFINAVVACHLIF